MPFTYFIDKNKFINKKCIIEEVNYFENK